MTTTSLHSKLFCTFSIDFRCKFDINDIAKALWMITETMKSIANETLLMIINGTLMNKTLKTFQISDLWSKAQDNHKLIQCLDAYRNPFMVYFDNIHPLFGLISMCCFKYLGRHFHNPIPIFANFFATLNASHAIDQYPNHLFDDSKRGINIFKPKHLRQMNKLRDIIKKVPIIPVFMDITTNISVALSTCNNYSKHMNSQWIDSIRARNKIHSEYISYTTQYNIFIHNLRTYLKHGNEKFGNKIMDSGAEGVKLLICGIQLIDGHVNYRNKLNINVIIRILYIKWKDCNKSKSYEQITRFNYSNELKYAMVKDSVSIFEMLANESNSIFHVPEGSPFMMYA